MHNRKCYCFDKNSNVMWHKAKLLNKPPYHVYTKNKNKRLQIKLGIFAFTCLFSKFGINSIYMYVPFIHLNWCLKMFIYWFLKNNFVIYRYIAVDFRC